MKKDSAAWKSRTQNLEATCTLIMSTNLEYFMKFILDMIYIFLNFGKSGV